MALGSWYLPTCPQLQQQYFYVALLTTEKIEVTDNIRMRKKGEKEAEVKDFLFTVLSTNYMYDQKRDSKNNK